MCHELLGLIAAAKLNALLPGHSSSCAQDSSFLPVKALEQSCYEICTVVPIVSKCDLLCIITGNGDDDSGSVFELEGDAIGATAAAIPIDMSLERSRLLMETMDSLMDITFCHLQRRCDADQLPVVRGQYWELFSLCGCIQG